MSEIALYFYQLVPRIGHFGGEIKKNPPKLTKSQLAESSSRHQRELISHLSCRDQRELFRGTPAKFIRNLVDLTAIQHTVFTAVCPADPTPPWLCLLRGDARGLGRLQEYLAHKKT